MSGRLPTINLDDGDLPRVTAQAWDALEKANDPPRLFSHGGQLVRMEVGDHDAPILQPLSGDRLRYEVARAATWVKWKRDGVYPAKPPRDVVSDMLADPNPHLPILARIVHVPVFLPNAALHASPGYHAEGHVYYAPQPDFALPRLSENPTPQEVQRAKDLLLEQQLGDFPFTTPSERAHTVALLLQPFVRDLIDGPTPLYLVEKPTPGTGAGMLTDVICFVVLGGSPEILTLGNLENETSWTLTAVLSRSPTFVLIDNIHTLNSAALSAAITATVWSGRIIGTSQMAHVPVRCTWVATGNNPTLSNEIARRTVRIRLDANVERPWERTGFRYPDLRAWTRENRSNLVGAALTLIQAWRAAGEPAGSESLGMFESWAHVIGGILDVAGIEGFLANHSDFYGQSNDERRVWIHLFTRWWDQFKDREVGVRDVWKLSTGSGGDPIDVGLGDHSARSQQTRLGTRLMKMRNVQFGPFRLTEAGKRQGAQQWRLVKTEESGEKA